MLSNRYGYRYTVFVALSLLLHALIIAAFLWNMPDEEKPEEKKTKVEIQLKKRDQAVEKNVNEEHESAQQPSEEKQEQIKPVTRKSQNQKADPKKAEPKKAEPKKAEPKKAEPKKAEPKKSEPKKAEPKKAEPKKAEPKKAEPKKADPKKAEPKKAEPKKAEPKKAEPKKAEPKKAEPKKAEPKKAEPKKAEPKKSEDTQSSKEKIKKPSNSDISPDKPAANKGLKELAQPRKRLGSMEILDERSLSKMIVSSKSLDARFDKRNLTGERLKKSLNFFQKQEFISTLQLAFTYIEKNMDPPAWDGKRYYGEINFYITEEGDIEKIVIKKPSGHDGLDQSMVNALANTQRLPMPSDEKVKEVMYLTRKLLYYSEKDMRR